MKEFAKKITQDTRFQNFIMAVILIASILVGLETYPKLLKDYKQTFHILDLLIQVIFTIEVFLRILAHGKKPINFFKSGWNFFDFSVTAIFYLPFGGPFASVLRLVRILRVFRLVTALPRLQILVGALIKSVPSIGYVGVLLFVLFYIFAVVGYFEFGQSDPENFGTLGRAMLTLFQITTLDDWMTIYRAQSNTITATVYFVLFILLGTMIILNLFIGVILTGFDEVKKEVEESSESEEGRIKSDLKKVAGKIDALKTEIERISSKVK